MFEYLARQDIEDDEAQVETPPLILFLVDRAPPPERIDDPMLTGGEVMSGCWILEHWDSYENIGIYYCRTEGPTELTFDEASSYLDFGIC
jgi:hypothetical protein